MAFLKAFSGALGGAFADQWIDFYTVPANLPDSVALCAAERFVGEGGRSSNNKASEGIITDGSLILVPEGFSLLTFENGRLTGFVDEPGGYVWESENPNSKSIFAGDASREALLELTWKRFIFGGTPGAYQLALYVNAKEIPNNLFGTQTPVYWDDSYLGAQAGASARGTYTLKIVDPILFVKGFVPVEYYSDFRCSVFDFADFDNKAAAQLFNEVVASLSAAFSVYANSTPEGARVTRLQGDAVGFARSLSSVLESNYSWSTDRGIRLVRAAITAIDYDDSTKGLLEKVQRADALGGRRGFSNLQASYAEGIQAAGANPDGGAMGMAFMNMAMGSSGSVFGGFASPAEKVEEDSFLKLERLKGLLDKGVISQEDYDAVKRKTLGI